MKLFESMLWTPESGFYLLDHHLDRIKNSAKFFKYPFSSDIAADILNTLERELEMVGRNENKKVRLFLDQKGQFETDYEDAALREPSGPLALAIANRRIDPASVTVFHKTTERSMYIEAKPINDCSYDDLLFLNTENRVCETTRANIAVKLNGIWYTPPVSCGLLAGTYRRYLLEMGELEEKILYKDDLKNADEIVLLNSVRRRMPAYLV